MADLFESAASWLTGMLKNYASRPVVYCRGDKRVNVLATIGRTVFELDDGYGVLEKSQSRDFLVASGDLVLGGQVVEPAAGDRIEEVAGTVTLVHEVMAPGREPCWRYSDPYRKLLRIHTRQVAASSGCEACDPCDACQACDGCQGCQACDPECACDVVCQGCLACDPECGNCDATCQGCDACQNCDPECQDCNDCHCDSVCDGCLGCQNCDPECTCDTSCDGCQGCDPCEACDVACQGCLGCDPCLSCDGCDGCQACDPEY